MANPYLSVVIPTYNEERRIVPTLTAVAEYLQGQTYTAELVVIDDGSQDATIALVKAAAEKYPFLRLIANTKNQGKGAVVKQGMLAAKGSLRLFMDADSSTPITEVSKLLAIKNKDIVIGTRVVTTKRAITRHLLSAVSRFLIQAVVLPGITDTQCGFKLLSAQAADTIFPLITQEGWLFDVELLVIARERNFSIAQVPVQWTDSPHSSLRAGRAAMQSLRELIKIRQQRAQGFYTVVKD